MKNWKSFLLIVWIFIYVVMMFFSQTELFYWLAYCTSLVAILLWSEKHNFIPVICAMAVPLIEAGLMYQYLGSNAFIVDMEQFSTFYFVWGWRGYFIWLIVLPLGAYLISKILQK